MKIRGPAIFSFCALIFFIVWVYYAQDWRLQARLYPWAIGFPMVILAFIQVILDLRGYKAKETSDGAPVDFQFTKEIDPALAKKRAIVMFTWFFCFLLGVWLLGFPISIVIMMFSYLKIQSRESWITSISLTAIAFGFFWMLFVKLLTLPFPDGRIFVWLGLD
ncbi:MAG TPA: tripartite tricarboxylate transporter TctB family protein [Candidatus Binatia bacterium]